MTSHVPTLPTSFDPLIAEAKQRMRRRRLLVVAVLVLLGLGIAAGVIATRSPVGGGYTAVAWTRGQYTQMRDCESANAGPSLAGAALTASAGVTCQTAQAVMRAVRSSRCYTHSPCEAGSFRCSAYWSGRFWSSFQDTNHALCSDGPGRVVWDGG